MRMSDWSSDVCSSDLFGAEIEPGRRAHRIFDPRREIARERTGHRAEVGHRGADVEQLHRIDRRTAAAMILVRQRGEFHSGLPQIDRALPGCGAGEGRSEEHTSELQSLLRSSYAVFCL